MHAWVVQGGQGGLGLVTAHRQFGGQRAGEDLQAGLELIHLHLGKNLRSATRIVLAVGQVGGAQAQCGGLFRCFGSRGLIEQLLNAGIRSARKLAKAGRGRAGTGCKKGSEAEGREQPQAGDH